MVEKLEEGFVHVPSTAESPGEATTPWGTPGPDIASDDVFRT
jgi:hypothetical protein